MNQSEFAKFAEAVRPALLARAQSVTGDTESAADIVQDCMLKLWTMRAALDDYTSPEALAMTIVHNLSLNVLRSRKTSVELHDDVMSDAHPSAEQTMIASETSASINRVLASLPDGQQALIAMRHVEGMSIPEIARVTGSTEGAVRTALSRARVRIAEIFNRHQLSNR